MHLNYELWTFTLNPCTNILPICHNLFGLQQLFHISRGTYQNFNKQLVAMVNCLWNSKSFLPGTTNEIDEHLLTQSKVPKYRSRFDLVHHPAFFKYATEFYQRVSMWRWELGRNKSKNILIKSKDRKQEFTLDCVCLIVQNLTVFKYLPYIK